MLSFPTIQTTLFTKVLGTSCNVGNVSHEEHCFKGYITLLKTRKMVWYSTLIPFI